MATRRVFLLHRTAAASLLILLLFAGGAAADDASSDDDAGAPRTPGCSNKFQLVVNRAQKRRYSDEVVGTTEDRLRMGEVIGEDRWRWRRLPSQGGNKTPVRSI